MNKIPTVLVRDPEDRKHVLPEVNPGCEWAVAGEGVPRRKYDGTCIRVENSHPVFAVWARREVKPGKTPPDGFVEVERDEVTGKVVGWEPWSNSSFARLIEEALKVWAGEHPLPDAWRSDPPSGTYELIGPKINGNPERSREHRLVAHASATRPDQLWDASIHDETPPWFLVRFVGRKYGWEGVVWTHPDGRRAKLKFRDLPPVRCFQCEHPRHDEACPGLRDGAPCPCDWVEPAAPRTGWRRAREVDW